MKAKGLIVSILLAGMAAFPARSRAQSIFNYLLNGGSPDFATTAPVENGYINLANGNLHLEFHLASPAQRGSLAASSRETRSSPYTLLPC